MFVILKCILKNCLISVSDVFCPQLSNDVGSFPEIFNFHLQKVQNVWYLKKCIFNIFFLPSRSKAEHFLRRKGYFPKIPHSTKYCWNVSARFHERFATLQKYFTERLQKCFYVRIIFRSAIFHEIFVKSFLKTCKKCFGNFPCNDSGNVYETLLVIFREIFLQGCGNIV